MVNRDRTVLMVDSREDKPESWYGFVIVFLCWRVESHFRRRSVHVTVQNGSKIHSSTVIRMVVFVGMSDLVHTIVIGYPLICQQRSNFVPRVLSILKGIEEVQLFTHSWRIPPSAWHRISYHRHMTQDACQPHISVVVFDFIRS